MLRFRVIGLLIVFSLSCLAAQDTPEPEEPDFFFLTGGPYTQQRYSPQIIWANQWFQRGSGAAEEQSFIGAGRFEIGLTDRLEADLEFGIESLRQTNLGRTETTTELDGLMLGARYRLLTESSAPLTLTLGPQLLIPSRDAEGLGAGYGLDVTAARDWGGRFFLAASANWRRSSLDDHLAAVSALDSSNYALALGLRVLEATREENKHDVHAFVEVLRSVEETIEPGGVTGVPEWFAAPGIRYGFLSARGLLAEFGVAFPIGITSEAPDWGAILQIQVELASIF